MNKHEAPRFAALVTDVMGYYKQECSSFIQELWWDACCEFDYEQVAKAMNSHAKNPESGRFAPKVADIVKILSGSATDRASLAWGKVHDAMGSVGAYSDVVFDDPAIHASVEDCGGWPKMCRTEIDELGHLQHRFCNSYKAYVGRGTFDYPKRLPGDRSPDAEYEKKGIKPPKPALVGDIDKARLVYRSGGRNKTAIGFASIQDVEHRMLEKS